MGVHVSLEEVSNSYFPPNDFLKEFRGFDQKVLVFDWKVVFLSFSFFFWHFSDHFSLEFELPRPNTQFIFRFSKWVFLFLQKRGFFFFFFQSFICLTFSALFVIEFRCCGQYQFCWSPCTCLWITWASTCEKE